MDASMSIHAHAYVQHMKGYVNQHSCRVPRSGWQPIVRNRKPPVGASEHSRACIDGRQRLQLFLQRQSTCGVGLSIHRLFRIDDARAVAGRGGLAGSEQCTFQALVRRNAEDAQGYDAVASAIFSRVDLVSRMERDNVGGEPDDDRSKACRRGPRPPQPR